MDNYGKIIAKLRKANGMTQEDLGKALNVTYQAVSKWENNLSRPDLDTITQMCRIFNITVDEFINLANMTSNANNADVPLPAAPNTPVPAPEPQQATELAAASVSTLDAPEKETVQPETEKAPQKQASLHVGFLIGIICAVVVGLGCLIGIGIFLQSDFGAVGFAFSAILGYFLFSFIVLLGHDALPAELFLDCVFKSVNVPGVIFTLDIDGILFLIFYKIILAPLVSVVVWLFFVIGGFILSLFLSAFMFPFYIPRIFRETFRGGRQRPRKERTLKKRAAKESK